MYVVILAYMRIFKVPCDQGEQGVVTRYTQCSEYHTMQLSDSSTVVSTEETDSEGESPPVAPLAGSDVTTPRHGARSDS